MQLFKRGLFAEPGNPILSAPDPLRSPQRQLLWELTLSLKRCRKNSANAVDIVEFLVPSLLFS